jgi:hypothetical protein
MCRVRMRENVNGRRVWVKGVEDCSGWYETGEWKKCFVGVSGYPL